MPSSSSCAPCLSSPFGDRHEPHATADTPKPGVRPRRSGQARGDQLSAVPPLPFTAAPLEQQPHFTIARVPKSRNEPFGSNDGTRSPVQPLIDRALKPTLPVRVAELPAALRRQHPPRPRDLHATIGKSGLDRRSSRRRGQAARFRRRGEYRGLERSTAFIRCTLTPNSAASSAVEAPSL